MRKPSLHISFKPPLERTDGTALSEEDVKNLWYRLYVNGEMVLDDIGEMEFDFLMEDEPHGVKEVTMTSVLYGLESPQSGAVLVNFIPPAAPRDLAVEWDWQTTSLDGSVG